MKDQLYLLRPGFHKDGAGPFYCGDSVAVEGMLSFFPELRDAVDVHYLEFPRPRKPLVAKLGEANQSLPVLILAEQRTGEANATGISVAGATKFISDEKAIRSYLSKQYNLPAAS
jgi:hypothetical protein